MGIIPTGFIPEHMCRLYHEPYKENIMACIGRNVVILNLYQQVDKLMEIDLWVRDNMRRRVYYCEEFPKDAPVWVQYFYFSEQEDLMAFKLRWV